MKKLLRAICCLAAALSFEKTIAPDVIELAKRYESYVQSGK